MRPFKSRKSADIRAITSVSLFGKQFAAPLTITILLFIKHDMNLYPVYEISAVKLLSLFIERRRGDRGGSLDRLTAYARCRPLLMSLFQS